MKTANNFFKLEASPNGDMLDIGLAIEKLRPSKLKIGEEYDISNNFQNVFIDTTEKSLKEC